MSSDLLAEFDSFYQAPKKSQTSTTSASNDLSFRSGSEGNPRSGQASSSFQWQAPAAKANNDIWGGMTGFQSAADVQPANAPQNDIWGSFEAGTGQNNTPPQTTSQMSYSEFSTDPSRAASQNKPTIVRRPILDLFSGNINDTVPYSAPKPLIKTQPPRPAPIANSSYGEVLFDADEVDDDEDDFGEFETVAPETVAQPPPPPLTPHSLTGMFGSTTLESKPTRIALDLLSTTSCPIGGNLPYPQAPKSPSFKERNPFADLGVATKQVPAIPAEAGPKFATPVTAWPSYETKVSKAEPYIDSPVPVNEEEWGDFADLPSESPAVRQGNAVSNVEPDAWAWDAADQISEPKPAPKQVDSTPPTNIPPPSVILALFPPLFDLPQSTLFKAVASQPFSLKNRIISDPSTVDFLRAYLLIATVAARIIAGRKFRWKRDTLLSQAMKIGPAAAGGKGGMKLTGVDKAEITREDREATDVVRVWKEQLGRLRSAIAVANSSIHDASAHLTIPDVNENMYVKTLEGGLTAPKPCLICGLKREERINKVDVQVEDSFGEWWIEHWGHRACRNFWLEHETKLKHR